MTEAHSPLLTNLLPYLEKAFLESSLPILDLACGMGRNGLFLAEKGLPVVFADRNAEALNALQQTLQSKQWNQCKTWLADFEASDNLQPLPLHKFSSILVFRYLHRPLFPFIQQAICPGGLVVYETFTVDQPQFGRPNNPDFLLKHGELKKVFESWPILHDFEGIVEEPRTHAVAQLAIKKPR